MQRLSISRYQLEELWRAGDTMVAMSGKKWLQTSRLNAWAAEVETLFDEPMEPSTKLKLRTGVESIRSISNEPTRPGSYLSQDIRHQMALPPIVDALSYVFMTATFANTQIAEDEFSEILEAVLRTANSPDATVYSVAATCGRDELVIRRARAMAIDLGIIEKKLGDGFHIDNAKAIDWLKRPTSPSSAYQTDALIPLHYAHLAEPLQRFWRDADYSTSVFVMMKFPSDGMAREERECLESIYDCISLELQRHGLTARRADKKTFVRSKILWDNLCTYMIGCKYGIAVLQDKVGDELNPNVTLEYGFMTALGRDVVLIQEQSFKHIRADILATIPKKFEIAPALSLNKASLRDAVGNWLIDEGVPPKSAQ